jgi:TDG/mug DNA glycosylase family protein
MMDTCRLQPDYPFPPYSFVPGRFPHPFSDPAGHSYGRELTSATVDPDHWRDSRTYLHGLDLFNAGFYWEAHEIWEGLWYGADRDGPTSDFLKALIRLAAAGVKVREGKARGVHDHADAAARLFHRIADDFKEPRCLGLDLAELESFAHRAADTPVQVDFVEPRPVFNFALKPQPWFVPNGCRPSAADLAAANGRGVPDVFKRRLKVLFCGINPGLYSAAVGHHFARPGNRFWAALHLGGFTPRQLRPDEEAELLRCGCGITNLAERATASADELTDAELIEGGRVLTEKVKRLRPGAVAFLGVSAYRTAFGHPKAGIGAQKERLADAEVWVLPNPSGLNAHYTLADLGKLLAKLRRKLDRRKPAR